MARRLRAASLLAGLAASLGLTYLALRDVDFGRFRGAVADGDVRWYAASLAVFAAAYALRAARWRLLFAPGTRPPIRPLVWALIAGEFVTSLLPAVRPGEVARVVVLHRNARTPRSAALGTVVTERIHDAAALLVLFFAATPFAPEVTWLRAAAIALAALAVAAVATLVLVRRFGHRPVAFVLRPFARLPGFSRARTDLAAGGVVRGLSGLTDARSAAAAFSLSLASWFAIALSFTLALRGAQLDVGLAAGILVAVATTFSLLLPSLPAAVGLFEAAALVALEPFGVDESRALSGAVVIHVLSFGPFLVAGPLALRRRG
ncbi:MAG: flippase-like domain-containing protein [Actinomycetota bacterium]|nr:flippase-like domain-containing protein [Actinomycetota bacterium]